MRFFLIINKPKKKMKFNLNKHIIKKADFFMMHPKYEKCSTEKPEVEKENKDKNS